MKRMLLVMFLIGFTLSVSQAIGFEIQSEDLLTLEKALNSPNKTSDLQADQQAEKDEDDNAANLLASWIEEVSPYISISKGNFLLFDENTAIDNGVSKEAISLARAIEVFNNKLLSEAKISKHLLTRRDKRLFLILDPFFKRVAQGKLGSDSMQMPLWSEYCGGGFDNPHFCPTRTRSLNMYKKKSSVVSALKTFGFHKTSAVGSFGAPDDYTECIDAYGCGGKLFRKHGRIEKVGNYYTYSTQYPEPNPEIDTYDAPTWWWDSYCAWWHLHYC